MSLPLGGEAAIREKVIERAAPLKGMRTLEIFAGTASLSLLAARRGASPIAFDISAGMLKAARFKAARSDLLLNIVRGDAARLPFSEGAFDRVIVSMGLHETESSAVPQILKESYRVLKDGGRLVLFDFYGAEEGAPRVMQSLFFTFAEGETAKAWVRTDVQAIVSGTGFKNFKREFLHRRAFQLLTAEKR